LSSPFSIDRSVVVLAARRGRLWLLGGGGGEQRVAKWDV
jgi:hypothetical protein